MIDPDAPLILQQWIANPPSWLTVQSVPEVKCLRVIDESSEDHLYPQKRFVIVELPKEV